MRDLTENSSTYKQCYFVELSGKDILNHRPSSILSKKTHYYKVVKNYLKENEICKICHQKDDPKAHKDKAPLHPWSTQTHRNQRIHMELVGKSKSDDGLHYILTITDASTWLIELVPIRDKESLTVAEALFDNWICRHGSKRPWRRIYIGSHEGIAESVFHKTPYNQPFQPTRQRYDRTGTPIPQGIC